MLVILGMVVVIAFSAYLYIQLPFKQSNLLGKYANLDCVNNCSLACQKIKNVKDKQMCYNGCMTKCSQL